MLGRAMVIREITEFIIQFLILSTLQTFSVKDLYRYKEIV